METDGERTLHITAAPWTTFQRQTLETAEAVAEGQPDENRVVAFEDTTAIQRLLTPKRLELLKSVMADPPASLRQLAARLDRSPSEVHSDVHLLADYDIIEVETVGRAKRPSVPYDSIEIEVTLSL
jgi:predicted transcriptional regulator